MINNEIKEILDYKENADYKKISCDEIAILKNYIADLEQENEKLKSRIEKAVEYLKEHSSNGEHFMEWFECTELLYILNGRSDE